MRSDTWALLKVFGWSFAVAVIVLGVAAATTVGWIPREAAPYWMLGVIVAGGVAIGRRLGPALLRARPAKGKPTEPGAASDRGGAK